MNPKKFPATPPKRGARGLTKRQEAPSKWPHPGLPEKFPGRRPQAGAVCHGESQNLHALERALRAQNQLLARCLNSLVFENSPPSKFLDHLLSAITHELEAHSSSVWSFDLEKGLTSLEETATHNSVLAGLRQLKHPLAGRRGKLKSRLFAKAALSGPIEISEVGRSHLLEPSVRKWMRQQGVKSLLCVPLRNGKEVIGVLTIRDPKPGGFLEGNGHLVDALANLVCLAITVTKRLEQEAETLTLKERNRMASEIHDSLSQSLTAAALQMEIASGGLGPDSESLRPHLGLALKMIRQGQEEVRRSIWALPPLGLQGRTLPEAIRQMATRLTEGTPLNVEFHLRGKPRGLSREIASDLFRITQEAVNNAIRHGRAAKIEIRLAYSARRIELTVENDGESFDLARSKTRPGAGLANMRRRAGRAGGRFSIRKGRKDGACVRLVLPIPAA